MRKQPSDSEPKQKKKEKRAYIVILILLLIILLLLLQQCCHGRRRGVSVQTGGVLLTPDPDAKEENEPGMNDGPAGVAIAGWGEIVIPSDTTKIAVDFFNPEENADMYYLTFELRLPDDSAQGYEALYTSGLVAPGLHIQNITLTRALPAGEYDATIHVQPYRMDENRTPTNNADLKTKLIVK